MTIITVECIWGIDAVHSNFDWQFQSRKTPPFKVSIQMWAEWDKKLLFSLSPECDVVAQNSIKYHPEQWNKNSLKFLRWSFHRKSYKFCPSRTKNGRNADWVNCGRNFKIDYLTKMVFFLWILSVYGIGSFTRFWLSSENNCC